MDPALTLYAIERFVEILGATSKSAVVEWARDDTLGAEDVSQKVDLALTNVNGALGTQLDLATCHSLLRRLGFTCELSTEEQTLHVIVGSSRSDVREAADLIEEIARLYGYDRIPTTFPREPIIGLGRDKWQTTREGTRDAMVDAGLREVLTYTMTSELVEARLLAGAPAESLAPHVRLLQPAKRGAIGTPSVFAAGAVGLCRAQPAFPRRLPHLRDWRCASAGTPGPGSQGFRGNAGCSALL